MSYVTKIMDRLGYEEKDERFVKNFVKEYEENFRYVRRKVSEKNVPTELVKLDVTMKGEKLLRIKSLEGVINKKATFFFIQVHDDGFSVIRK